jgi:hypothetical protein
MRELDPRIQDAIEQMREAGYAWLTAVYDTCGNINQNSWGKGTGGEWSSTKRTVIHVGEEIGICAIAMAENADDIEFRFSVQPSGRAFVTRRDWTRSPEWKWLIQESDIGRRVCVMISIRRRKAYYQFADADDYTYAIYDVLPGRELVKPQRGEQEVTMAVPQQQVTAQSGLPPLLSGSAFVVEDVDERRKANHLGQAIAVLVHARKSHLGPKAEETLLDLFEQELERTRRYIHRSEEYRERKYGPSPILLGGHAGPALPLLMDSAKEWLRDSLGKQPDWPELARLIQRQRDEYAHKDCRYDRQWWRAVERVCEKAHVTQEEYDPIGEILRIADQCERDRDKRVSADVSSPKRCESEKQPDEQGRAGEIPLVGSCVRRFKAALSFLGERRAFIEQVASHLAGRLGRGYVLYDKYHEAELARPDLDVYLPNLYRTQSELVAVFLCADYAKKRWCRLEWRSIRQMISTTDAERIMFLSFDDIGPVPEIGILSGDGYVSIDGRPHQEIAGLILQRLKSNSARKE